MNGRRVPKKSKAVITSPHVRAKERRPRYNAHGTMIDDGCPHYWRCLDEAARRDLRAVPCDGCGGDESWIGQKN